MTRPAFYALPRGSWRDWITLLHPPYTAWHLSYVVVGGCLVASVDWGVLGLTVLAFFLALGIGAHALDELHARPLGTAIPRAALFAAAGVSVAAACAIGIAVAIDRTLWLVLPIAVGAILVPAYNLELAGGRLHNDLWFALGWGAFPVVTAYLAQAETVRVETLVAAIWATLLSLAQRALSRPARRLRRDVVGVAGQLDLGDGRVEQLDRAALLAPLETALRLLTLATIAIAASLAVLRL